MYVVNCGYVVFISSQLRTFSNRMATHQHPHPSYGLLDTARNEEEEEVMARAALDDPALSACCVRDLEDRMKSSKIKARLRALDPVEKAVRERQDAARAWSMVRPTAAVAFRGPVEHGTWIETNECNVLALARSPEDRFVVCLARAPVVTEIENRIKDWLEGFQAVLVTHQFTASQCSSCVVNESTSLPALVVWNSGSRVAELDRRQLEMETEGGLIGRLTMLKKTNNVVLADGKSKSIINNNEDSDDEDVKSGGRTGFFQCNTCDRHFFHVHVPPKQKADWGVSITGSRRHRDDEDEDDMRDVDE